MLTHPQFDPVALHLGPLAVRWYGLMYLLGFALFIWLGRLRVRQQPFARLGWSPSMVEDLLFYGVLGVVLGGRLGFVLFYQPAFYAANPVAILRVWEGGMSFHGGLIGVLVALALYAWRHGHHWLDLTDLIAPCIPTGLAAGRLGNFINGELWGRPTDMPWGMVFPQAHDALPRHPSQLYQLGLEGLLLFALLWWWSRRERPRGAVSGLFLLGYGAARFTVEFYREPDRYLGVLSLGMTMGQWLCLPMLALGLWLLWRAYRRPTV